MMNYYARVLDGLVVEVLVSSFDRLPDSGNDSTTLTLGITLQATDVVTVSAGTADRLSINAFGAEVTV